jgi:death on curing protein
MTEWRWIDPKVIQAVHEAQLAEHGGLDGVRDQGLVESALARPQNLAAYGEPDAADLAAAYAYGIARNHGFADGNKRTGWIAARLFLADNDHTLVAEKADVVMLMLNLAAGLVDETTVAAWFRARIHPNLRSHEHRISTCQTTEAQGQTVRPTDHHTGRGRKLLPLLEPIARKP